LVQERLVARRDQLRDQILAERDEGLAVAGLLLVFGALFANGAMVLFGNDQRRPALAAGSAGLLLMAGAPIAWVARPDLDTVGLRLAAEAPRRAAEVATAQGPLVCRPDLERSRLTVSEPRELSLDWSGQGCEGARTQYADADGRFERADVAPGGATVALRRFDPGTRQLTVERYFLSADAMAAARALQEKYTERRCDAEGARTTNALNGALRDLLPPTPNERLVYACETGQDRPR
jgi:hypothetical protein